MSRATEDRLNSLHGLVADSFAEEIRKYREGVYSDAEGNALPIPASLLANAAKLLKDNGIDRPGKAEEALDSLAGQLPDLDDVIGDRPH